MSTSVQPRSGGGVLVAIALVALPCPRRPSSTAARSAASCVTARARPSLAPP